MSEALFDERTRRLIGEAGMEKLHQSHVIVAGLGGVGSHGVEALARAGVGRLTLIDFDRVAESNLNRQLLATRLNIGQLKTEAMFERIQSIRPDCDCQLVSLHLTPENLSALMDEWRPADALMDCIDQLPSKAALIAEACRRDLPVFTSMGAGKRLDPTKIRVSDIHQTTHCPLARKLKRLLKETGVEKGVTAVYSIENPCSPPDQAPIIGSISYMPPLFGYTLAGKVIQHLLGSILDVPSFDSPMSP